MNNVDSNDNSSNNHEIIVETYNNNIHHDAVIVNSEIDVPISSQQSHTTSTITGTKDTSSNNLPTYKDQVRPHQFSNSSNYAMKDQGDSTRATAATMLPIAHAIITTSTTSAITMPTILPPNEYSPNFDQETNSATKSRWTCTRISLFIVFLVIVAAAVIPSVLLCRDGDCSGTTAFTSSSTFSTDYFEDDLVVLQNAVDEYYAAIASIGTSIDGENDADETIRKELMNVPVIRQYGYPISSWDVSRVTNFTSLFDGKRNEQLVLTFNEDLGNWNVSAAVDMFRMFGKLNVYEGYGLEHWDVSNVINMRGMFQEGYRFRGNVSFWDIRKAKTLTRMFSDCYVFNTDISSWQTSNVDSMAWMFFDARMFNQDISSWDVSKVEDFSDMFLKALVFNQDISGWTVTSSKEMLHMFEDTLAFNQDLSSWDVRNNKNFFKMFSNARAFNQSLCQWSTKILATANVSGMFEVTSCLNTSDPMSSGGIYLSNGPFCHPCNQPANQGDGGQACGDGFIGNGVCSDIALCCSTFGYCGSTAEHCAKDTCGNGARGNGTCTNPDLCCSPSGYCGSTSEYCTLDACGNGSRGNGNCTNPDLCCSPSGYCGSTSEYCTLDACGNGSIGNGNCTDPNLCCSSSGYCGSTFEYCG